MKYGLGKIRENITQNLLDKGNFMKPGIAKIWKEALRSGKYNQVQGFLAKKNSKDKDYSYCCLGVLCEIYFSKHPELKVNETHLQKSYGEERDYYQLPNIVQKWAGMQTNKGSFSGNEGNLIKLNDSGFTFHEIADIICKNQIEL